VKNYNAISVSSLIIFGIRKNCLIGGRSLSYRFTIRVIKVTAVIVMGYHCYQLHNNVIQYPSSIAKSTDEIIGDHQYRLQLTDQQLIRYFAFIRYWRKNGSTMRCTSAIQTLRKPLIQ
jgi:hypothetical protein